MNLFTSIKSNLKESNLNVTKLSDELLERLDNGESIKIYHCDNCDSYFDADSIIEEDVNLESHYGVSDLFSNSTMGKISVCPYCKDENIVEKGTFDLDRVVEEYIDTHQEEIYDLFNSKHPELVTSDTIVEEEYPDLVFEIAKEQVFGGKNMNESTTEEYFDAKEITRKGFLALLKLNNTDIKGNNYIITRDGQDVERFTATTDEEAINKFEAFRKELDTGLVDIAPRDLNTSKITEAENVENIDWLFYSYDDLDFIDKEHLGSDAVYHTLLTSVQDAKEYNYHSDYWGNADEYQEKAVNLLSDVEPLVGKLCEYDVDDTTYTVEVKGVYIDDQYNSHLKLAVEWPKTIKDSEKPESKKCVLCNKEFTEYGNNPWPLADKGQCCNDCNINKVLPARIHILQKSSKKEDIKEGDSYRVGEEELVKAFDDTTFIEPNLHITIKDAGVYKRVDTNKEGTKEVYIAKATIYPDPEFYGISEAVGIPASYDYEEKQLDFIPENVLPYDTENEEYNEELLFTMINKVEDELISYLNTVLH